MPGKTGSTDHPFPTKNNSASITKNQPKNSKTLTGNTGEPSCTIGKLACHDEQRSSTTGKLACHDKQPPCTTGKRACHDEQPPCTTGKLACRDEQPPCTIRSRKITP